MNNEAIRKDWVGQVVDSRFRLVEWVASAGQSGVFTCEVDGDAEHKAAIKLFLPMRRARMRALRAGRLPWRFLTRT